MLRQCQAIKFSSGQDYQDFTPPTRMPTLTAYKISKHIRDWKQSVTQFWAVIFSSSEDYLDFTTFLWMPTLNQQAYQRLEAECCTIPLIEAVQFNAAYLEAHPKYLQKILEIGNRMLLNFHSDKQSNFPPGGWPGFYYYPDAYSDVEHQERVLIPISVLQGILLCVSFKYIK